MLHKVSMMKSIDYQSEVAVKKIVDKIIFSRVYSRNDHSLLTEIILNNSDVSDAERRQIYRIFDYLQTGQLKLIGW
ncbi:hypothetical protein NIES2101_04415 [Calothrix sp. HK-06]|nr:hypothetical protein NIES2101_04415 [Calothrix sp. HK-06]